MDVVIRKPRTDEVELCLGDEAVSLTTQEFHHLVKILKQFDAKKWDKDSLILLKEKL